MIDLRDIEQAQNKAVDLRPTGLEQVNSGPRLNNYTREMYVTKPYGGSRWDQLGLVSQNIDYTSWYEGHKQKHPTGFEFEGIMQLQKERTLRNYQKVQRGEMGYEDFLMKSYGYDLLKTEGHDLTNPMYWYKKYQNMDFSNPINNNVTLANTLALAEREFQKSNIDDLIYQPNPVFEDYISGISGTAETMEKMFGATWEQLKEESDGDEQEALKKLKSTGTAINRFSEDGTKYVHTNGKVYDVVREDDARAGSRSVVTAKYNEDGTIDSIRIGENKVTGNILLDNIVSGATGFAIDMVKTVSQLGGILWDVTGDAIAEGDFELDTSLEIGMAFESFKNSNPFTAKEYIDMDGFELSNMTDWADVFGDFTGMIIGMSMMGAAGGAIGSSRTIGQGAAATVEYSGVAKSFMNGGKAMKGIGHILSGTGKTISSVSNVYTSSATRGIQNALLSRAAFAVTHATKDGLQTLTNQQLQGKSTAEAVTSGVKVLGMNTLITSILGSGSKDDTWRAFKFLDKGLLKYAKAPSGLTESMIAKQALKAGLITGGLDFFDNFLTMQVAQSYESKGKLELTAEELLDGRSIIMSALMARNAVTGAQRSYRYNNIAADAPMRTYKQYVQRLEELSQTGTDENKLKARVLVNQIKQDMTKAITDARSKATPENTNELVSTAIANELSNIHQKMADQSGKSPILEEFAKVVNSDQLGTYKDIYSQVMKLNEAYSLQPDGMFKGIMKHGFLGYVKDMAFGSGTGIKETDFNEWLQKTYTYIDKMTYPSRDEHIKAAYDIALDILPKGEATTKEDIVLTRAEVEEQTLTTRELQKIEDDVKRFEDEVRAKETETNRTKGIKGTGIESNIVSIVDRFRERLTLETKARKRGGTLGELPKDLFDSQYVKSITVDSLGKLLDTLPEARQQDVSKYFEVIKYDAEKRAMRLAMKRGDKNQGTDEYRLIEETLHMLADTVPELIQFEKDGTFYLPSASLLGPVEVFQRVNTSMAIMRKIGDASTIQDKHDLLVEFTKSNFERIEDVGQVDSIIKGVRFAVKTGYLTANQAVSILGEYRDNQMSTYTGDGYWQASRFLNKMEEGDVDALIKYSDEMSPEGHDVVKQIKNGKNVEALISLVREGKKGAIPFTSKFASTFVFEKLQEENQKLGEVPFHSEVVAIVKAPGSLTNTLKKNWKFLFKSESDYRKATAYLNKFYEDTTDRLKKGNTKYNVMKDLAMNKPELFREGRAEDLIREVLVNRAADFHYNKSTTKQLAPDEIIINLEELLPATVWHALEAMDKYYGNTNMLNRYSTLIGYMAGTYKNKKYAKNIQGLYNELYTQKSVMENLYQRFGDTKIRLKKQDAKNLLNSLGYWGEMVDYKQVYRIPGVENGDARVFGMELELKKEIEDLKNKTLGKLVRYQGEMQFTDPVVEGINLRNGEGLFTADTVLNGDFIRLLGDLTDEQSTTFAYYDNQEKKMKIATMGGKGYIIDRKAIMGRFAKVTQDDGLDYKDAMITLFDSLEEGGSTRFDIDGTKPKEQLVKELSKYWRVIDEGKYITVTDFKTDVAREALINHEFSFNEAFQKPADVYFEGNILNVLSSPVVTWQDRIFGERTNINTNEQNSVWGHIEAMDDIRLKQYLYNQMLPLTTGKFVEPSYNTDDIRINDEGKIEYKPIELPSRKVGEIIDYLSKKPTRNRIEQQLLDVLNANLRTEVSIRDKVLSDIDLLNKIKETTDIDELYDYVNNRNQDLTEDMAMEVQSPITTLDDQRIVAPITPYTLDGRHTYDEYEFKNNVPEIIAEVNRRINDVHTDVELDVTPEMKAKSLIEEDGFVPYHRLVGASDETIAELKKLVTNPEKIDEAIAELKEIYNISLNDKETNRLKLGVYTDIVKKDHPSIRATYKWLVNNKGTKLDGELLNTLRGNNKYRYEKEKYNNLFNRGGFESMMRSSEQKGSYYPEIKYKNDVDKQALAGRLESIGLGDKTNVDDIFDRLRFQKNGENASYLFLREDGTVIEDMTVYGKYDSDLNSMLLEKNTYKKLYSKSPEAKYVVVSDSEYKASLFEQYKVTALDLDETIKIDGNDFTYRGYLQKRAQLDFGEYVRNQNQDLYEKMIDSKVWTKIVEDGKSKEFKAYLQYAKQYLLNNQSKPKKVEFAVKNMFPGEEDTAMEIVNLFRNFERDVKTGEASGQDIITFKYINGFDDYSDSRINNDSANEILEQAINGYNPKAVSEETKAIKQKNINDLINTIISKNPELETIQKEITAFVRKAMTNLTNKTSGRQEVLTKEIEAIKAFGVDRALPLVMATVLDYSKTGNAGRVLLSKDYTINDAMKDFNEGINVEFKDTYKLLNNKKLIIYDIEALTDDIRNVDNPNTSNYMLAAGLKQVTFTLDKNNNVKMKLEDFNKDIGGVYRFKQDERTLKNLAEQTLKEIEASGEDVSGLRSEIEKSFNLKTDNKDMFVKDVTDLINKGYKFIAHNGLGFDSKVIEDVFQIKNFADNNIDSLDILRDTAFKTRSNEEGLDVMRQSSRMIDYAKLYDENAKQIHGVEEDVEMLAKTVRSALEQSNKLELSGGKVIDEMQEIAKTLGVNKNTAISSITKLTQPLQKLKQESNKTLPYMLGLDVNSTYLNRMQRINEMVNVLNEGARVKRQLNEALINKNYNYDIPDVSKKVIQQQGIDFLAKLAGFMSTHETTRTASKFNSAIEKITKAIENSTTENSYVNRDGKRVITTKEFTRRLLNPDTYNKDFLDAVGLSEEEFNGFVANRFDDKNIYTETPEFDLEERKMAKNYFFYNMPIIKDFLDVNKNIEGIENINNFTYSRLAKPYSVSFNPKDFQVTDEIELYNSRSASRKFVESHRAVLEDLVAGAGMSPHIQKSEWGNVLQSNLGESYEVFTKDGTISREFQALDVGISQDKADTLFSNWRENPDELYGFMMGYPSDNLASMVPVRYRVLSGDLKNNSIVDITVLQSIQRDVDGDKMSFFGEEVPAKVEALKHLIDVYETPFQMIRDNLQRLMTSTEMNTRPYVKAVIETFGKGSEDYSGLKASEFEALMKTKYPELNAEEIDTLVKTHTGEGLDVSEELFLARKSIFNDQIGGMGNKDKKDFIEMLDRYEKQELFNRDNILSKSKRRTIGMPPMLEMLLADNPQEARRIVNAANIELVKRLSDIETNNKFWDLQEQLEINPEFNRAVNQIDKMNKLYNEALGTEGKQFDFIPGGKGEASGEEVLRYFQNQIDRESVTDPNNNYVTSLKFPNQKKLKVLLIDTDEDVAYLTKQGFDKLEQSKETSIHRSPGMRMTDTLEDRMNFKGISIDSFKKKNLTTYFLDHFKNGLFKYTHKPAGIAIQVKEYEDFLANLSYERIDNNLQGFWELATSSRPSRYREALSFLEEYRELPFYNEMLMQLAMLKRLSQVKDDTKIIAEILEDKSFIESTQKLYDILDEDKSMDYDANNFISGIIRKIDEGIRKEDVYIYKGMPLFEDGDEVRRANSSGYVRSLDDNGIVFEETTPLDNAGIKIALGRTGAGKLMQQYQDNPIDAPYDIIASARGFIEGKNQKALQEQLAQHFDSTVTEGSVELGGVTRKGYVADIDTFFIENINANDKKVGSKSTPFVNKDGAVIDLMGVISNALTPMGKVVLKDVPFRKLMNELDGNKNQVVLENDLGLPLANMRFQALLGLLDDQQKEMFNPNQKGYNSNTYKFMGQWLKRYEAEIRELIKGKDIDDLIVERYGYKYKSKGFNLIKNLLGDKVKDALYLKQTTDAKMAEQKVTAKAQRPTAEEVRKADGSRTSQLDVEYKKYLPNGLNRVDYSQFWKLLGLYMNMYDAQIYTKNGTLGLDRHLNGSPADNFRTRQNIDEAIEYDALTSQNPEGDPKAGLISKVTEIIGTLGSGRSKYEELYGEEGAINFKLDGEEHVKDVNPHEGQREHLVKKALGTAMELNKRGENKNSDLFDVMMRRYKTKVNANVRNINNSVNLGLNADGRIISKPVMNMMDYTMSLSKNKAKVSGGSSAEQYRMRTRGVAGEEQLREITYEPIVKVDIPMDKRQMIKYADDVHSQARQDFTKLEKAFSMVNEINENSDFKLEVGENVRKIYSVEKVKNTNAILGKNIDFELIRSWFSGSGAKRVDELSYRMDKKIGDVKRTYAYSYGEMMNKFAVLYSALNSAGSKAQDQFALLFEYTKALNFLEVSKHNVTELGKDHADALMKTLGITDIEQLQSSMRKFVDDYTNQNGAVVKAFYDSSEVLLKKARETATLTEEPLADMYIIMTPVALKDNKTYNKQKLINRAKAGFSPKKYDNVNDITDMTFRDPIQSMNMLAKDIATSIALKKFSEALIEEGLIDNVKVLDKSYEYLRSKITSLTKAQREEVNQNLQYSRYELRTFSGANAKMFEDAFDRYRKEGNDEFDSHIKATDDFVNMYKQNITSVIQRKEYLDMLGTVEGIVKLRDIITEPNKNKALKELEKAMEFRNHSFSTIVKDIDTSDFKTFLKNQTQNKYAIVDKYNRSYDNFKMYPLHERSVEYLEASLRLASNESRELLRMAVEGQVFLGSKSLTEHLHKYFFTHDANNTIKETLKNAGRIGNRWIMGNPFKLISRFERFTFTDSMMAVMANTKTPFYIPKARKLLSAYMGSHGKATDPILEQYLEQRGNTPGSEKLKDPMTKQEDMPGKEAFQRNNGVSIVLDTVLDELNMQHDLVRLALFMATMDDIKTKGEIKGWGAARAYKDGINSLNTDAEKAFRVVAENIATFGDMPFLLRKASPLFVFASYILGQTRWVGNWGLSMKHDAADVARSNDTKGAMKNLLKPGLGIAGMYVMGNLIYQMLADMFDVDEETEEEWKDDRPYMEFFGTMINGSPTANFTPGMPAEAFYNDWIKTIGEGMDKGGLLGIPKAFANKQFLARLNPFLKVPLEAATGKNYFTATPIEDSYDTNFIENYIRRATGLFVGTQTVNAFIDNQKFAQYRDNDRGALYDVMVGMKNAIASEYGNSRAYKRDVKDFYRARSLVYDKLDDEGYFDYEPSDGYASNSDYDETKAKELKTLFRKAIKRNEPVSTLYNIAYDEMEKGTSPSTVHSALNGVSVYRLLDKLEDKETFIASLTDKEDQILKNAMKFELEMFPGLKEVNMYDSAGGSSYIPNYIPYNPYKYMPYEYDYDNYRDRKKDVTVYPSMGGYYNRYDERGLFQRWKDNEKVYKKWQND